VVLKCVTGFRVTVLNTLPRISNDNLSERILITQMKIFDVSFSPWVIMLLAWPCKELGIAAKNRSCHLHSKFWIYIFQVPSCRIACRGSSLSWFSRAICINYRKKMLIEEDAPVCPSTCIMIHLWNSWTVLGYCLQMRDGHILSNSCMVTIYSIF
jgi:hypothetical protein